MDSSQRGDAGEGVEKKRTASKWKARRKIKPVAYVPPSEKTRSGEDSFFQLKEPSAAAEEEEDLTTTSDTNTTAIKRGEDKRKTPMVVNELDPDYDDDKDTQQERTDEPALKRQKVSNTEEVIAEGCRGCEDNPTDKEASFDNDNVILLDDDEDDEAGQQQEEKDTVENSNSVELIDGDENGASEFDGFEGLFPEDMDPEMRKRLQKRRQALKDGVRNAFPVEVTVIIEITGVNKQSTQFEIQSTDRFRDVRGKLLAYIGENGIIPGSDGYFSVEKGFFTHNNNVRVFDSSSPMSLGISRYDAQMNVSLISEEEFEARNERLAESYVVDKPKDKEEEEVIEENFGEGDITKDSDEAQDAEHDDNDRDGGFFTIYMAGKDNDRIGVQVNAETQISKLAAYYKTKKNMPEDTIVKLEFDDDELDLNGLVGDTELEEDYTIDVYV